MRDWLEVTAHRKQKFPEEWLRNTFGLCSALNGVRCRGFPSVARPYPLGIRPRIFQSVDPL